MEISALTQPLFGDTGRALPTGSSSQAERDTGSVPGQEGREGEGPVLERPGLDGLGQRLAPNAINAVIGATDSSGRAGNNKGGDGLTPEEKAVVERLRRRDREVRRHEQAHAAAGGRYTGAPNYEYERGPDGKRYAVGGDVSIDTSPIPGDPQANIQKFQQVRRAALAPAEPSAQDRRVAAEAQRQITASRGELSEQIATGQGDGASEADSANPNAGEANAPALDSGQVTNIVASVATLPEFTDTASRGLQSNAAFLHARSLQSPDAAVQRYIFG